MNCRLYRNSKITKFTYQDFESADVVPLRHLEDQQYVLETFYGRTACDQDVQLQLLAKLLDHYALERRDDSLRSAQQHKSV